VGCIVWVEIDISSIWVNVFRKQRYKLSANHLCVSDPGLCSLFPVFCWASPKAHKHLKFSKYFQNGTLIPPFHQNLNFGQCCQFFLCVCLGDINFYRDLNGFIPAKNIGIQWVVVLSLSPSFSLSSLFSWGRNLSIWEERNAHTIVKENVLAIKV
jgi:hypothetical protein